MGGPYAKQARYRERCRRAGLCPHCGQDAFPYRICAERRAMNRLYYHLNRLRAAGVVRRPAHGIYAMADAQARMPRNYQKDFAAGGPPRRFLSFVVALLRQTGKPMHEDGIMGAWKEHFMATAK